MNKATLEKTKGAFTKAKIYHYERLPLKIANEESQNQLSVFAKYVLFLKRMEKLSSFFERLIDAMVYELYFSEVIESANCEVLKYLTDLPELKDDWSDDKKIAIIDKVYKEFSDPKHPVSIAMSKMHEIPEVKIIEGRDRV